MPALTFDEVVSKRVRRFDAYWRAKAGNHELPRRSDIDPAEIRDLLPFLIIADVEQDPFRVRYRLCGTMIQELDTELAGRYLDELPNLTPEELSGISDAYRHAVETRRPHFSWMEFMSRPTGNPVIVHGGVWPLLGDKGMIGQCVAIQDYIGL